MKYKTYERLDYEFTCLFSGAIERIMIPHVYERMLNDSYESTLNLNSFEQYTSYDATISHKKYSTIAIEFKYRYNNNYSDYPTILFEEKKLKQLTQYMNYYNSVHYTSLFADGNVHIFSVKKSLPALQTLSTSTRNLTNNSRGSNPTAAQKEIYFLPKVSGGGIYVANYKIDVPKITREDVLNLIENTNAYQEFLKINKDWTLEQFEHRCKQYNIK